MSNVEDKVESDFVEGKNSELRDSAVKFQNLVYASPRNYGKAREYFESLSPEEKYFIRTNSPYRNGLSVLTFSSI